MFCCELYHLDSILTPDSSPLLSEPPSAKPSGTPSRLAALFKTVSGDPASSYMIELLEAERCVAESNALIERQRRLIEELAYDGNDIISAQIVFDSLCVSLSLHVQARHRLRGTLNVKVA